MQSRNFENISDFFFGEILKELFKFFEPFAKSQVGNEKNALPNGKCQFTHLILFRTSNSQNCSFC